MAAQTFTIPGSDTGTGKVVHSTSGSWASLSDDIVFEANQSAVEMMMRPNVAVFAKQNLLTGKPRLQKMGVELQELKPVFKFHFFIASFKAIKAALTAAAYNGTILTWIWGTGEVLGDFIILHWEEKIKKTDETGQIYATEIELTLMEYVGATVTDQTAAAASAAGFANKDLGTQTFTIPGSDTGTGAITSVDNISENISEVNVANDKVQDRFNLLLTGQISLANFKRTAAKYLGQITASTANINASVSVAGNIKNGAALVSASASVSTSAGNLSGALTGFVTVNDISALTADLNLNISLFNTAAQPSQVVFSWFASENL